MKSWWVIGGAMLLANCREHEVEKRHPRVAVRIRALDEASRLSTARYSATINAASRADLSFRAPGYIEYVASIKGPDGVMRQVQEGDRVSKGLLLARLRKSDFENKVAEANAMLLEANSAKAQARRDYDRAERLFESSSISKSEFEGAKVKTQGATARAQAAKARLAEAQEALSDTSLEAPMDGVVVRRNVELGTLSSPSVPCFSIADTSRVKVLFNVPDIDLSQLKVGAEQEVATQAYPNRLFKGQISRVAPNADAKSHTFEVEVTLPNPEDLLKPGMLAALTLNGSAANDATPSVPLGAVLRSPQNPSKYAVYVVERQTAGLVARLREVELGSFVGSSIAVKKGLKTGEQVVVMGASLLSDGTEVTVIP